jgi:nuclear polyadenylated RNA-binding protein 3
MADVNQEDTDDAYDPTQPQDYGDYNPESIDYEAQDDDSAEEEAYPGDNAANEPAQDPGFVEAAPQTVAQPSGSPIASRSSVASLSPTATRQYNNTEAQSSQPIQTTTNDHASITGSDPLKSPTIADVNDNPAIPSPGPQESNQDSSSLPKSVDLQALLAGLVPAKKLTAPNSPPQSRERPQPAAPQPNPSGNLPPPAMNLPSDIMYQLHNLTSPPPQNAPQFQQPPPNQAPPVQSGPVDIQPQDLALTSEEEHLYERFLQNEREVVQNANWDDFPYGSRMFIGNLPSERMGKKEVFRLFYPYGRLAQISIKQAYGFVQFYEKQDCENAIRAQQGMILTGRKVRMFQPLNVTDS